MPVTVVESGRRVDGGLPPWGAIPEVDGRRVLDYATHVLLVVRPQVQCSRHWAGFTALAAMGGADDYGRNATGIGT